MNEPFRLLTEYFWLVAVGLSALNYFRARRSFSGLYPGPNSQSSEAEAYLFRFAVSSSLPWVVMGAGKLSGSTPTVWHYFRPQDGNPLVLAWFATVFLLSVLYAWWVLFAGGARLVREFNLMAVVGQQSTRQSERSIKLWAAAGVLVFPVWVALAVSMNAKVPVQ